MNRTSRIRTSWMPMILALAFVQLLFFAIGSRSAPAAQENILLAAAQSSDKGDAPDFDLKSMDGSKVSLGSFKGNKPVLLYFWATWCPYCIQVKPQLAEMREKIPANEMEILGLNVGEGGDSFEKVKKYQELHPVTFPILYDEAGKTARIYGVQGIPLFVLVDKAGKIAYRGNALPTDVKKYLK